MSGDKTRFIISGAMATTSDDSTATFGAPSSGGGFQAAPAPNEQATMDPPPPFDEAVAQWGWSPSVGVHTLPAAP